jgi:hypothetical protein
MARGEMTPLKQYRIRAKTHRLIASRHPMVGVFDDLTADPDDLRDAFLLESLTNDRLAPVVGRIVALPNSEIITGPSASLVMAAFLHADDAGGRFTDARLGAWYAALNVETSIKETIYHNTRRLKKSAGGFPNRIQMRELMTTINTNLVDIRGEQAIRPELYRPDDYTQSQVFAADLRWPKSPPAANGIIFDSLRHSSGTNICMFWPSKVPLPIVQGDHYEYHWNAKGDVSVMKLTSVTI